MKKFILAVALGCTVWAYAQETETVTAEEQEKRDWLHADFGTTGIYGVGDQAAREFLNSKGLKPQSILVAVLDSGVEIDHEDLKNNIWTNPGEIAGNGIDDDKNGYVDDINGWDFMGGKNGEDINDDTLELTRIYKKFQSAFESEDEETNAANIAKMPETYQMYLDAKKEWHDHEKSANNPEQKKFFEKLAEGVKGLINEYSGDQKVDMAFVEKLSDPNMKNVLTNVANNADLTLDQIAKEIDAQLKPNPNYDLDFNPRPIVGDNYDDPHEKYYGNNEVEGPDAFHGTHVSGIIAAERNNGIGMDGIAGDVAKIMTLRTVPNGDERDKDVANSIYYAADNGAKIMNMSFGKGFSPYKEVVWKAIQYADRKGILMFHAAGNSNKELDTNANYPTNFREGISFTKNWVTVGASTRDNEKLRAGFSNYGKKQVDIFSPGTEIYSTIIDQSYGFAQGTSMASPAAAGCAALLWSYFPELTATQVKDLLLESVNVFEGVQTVGENEDKVPFNEISVTGGVIDVHKAAKLAYERYGKSKSMKK